MLTGKIKSNVVALLLILSASGCALIPEKSAGLDAAERLIAQDIVNVLVQMRPLPAASTTLAIPENALNNDSFLQALLPLVEEAGFAIRTGVPAATDHVVSYTMLRKTDEQAGAVMTYTVNVGQISVRRSYTPVSEGRVRPMAAMQVKGTDASRLKINDDIFGAASLPLQSSPSSPDRRSSILPVVPKVLTNLNLPTEGELAVNDTGPEPSAPAQTVTNIANGSVVSTTTRPLPGASLEAQALLNIAVPSVGNVPKVVAEFGTGDHLLERATANFRDLGESNFAALFENLGIVNETILTFDSDSTRLGAHNKFRVKQFVEKFIAKSDLLSIIGCANGHAGLAMGQKELAEGRAERVKEELLYVGVPASSILDEACWSDETFDQRLPRRGVVLTLRRRMS